MPFSSKLGWQIGLGTSKRIADVNIGFSNSKVFEDYIHIPVIIELNQLLTERTSFYGGAGANISVLYGQKFLFPTSVSIPSDFKADYGFGSYTKVGALLYLGFKHKVGKNTSLFINVGTSQKII